MDLRTLGRLIAEHRRSQGLTLHQLAAEAGVGRSTLAALEGGKLAELGYVKVSRICAVLGLVLEARPPELDRPLMQHRHLTELAGRELTKAAIDDVISRGDIRAWRGLVAAIQADSSGRVARRVRDVARALAKHEPRAEAFLSLLPRLHPKATKKQRSDG
jgi:transcriptional regulator with XRE-family HTH domain